MKIGVTGPKGRLGSWLVRQGCIPLDCDVTDLLSIEEAVNEIEPDVIVNCAAWTGVDSAEEEDNYAKVMEVNMRGPYRLRRFFVNGLLIQPSTGFVFDGKDGPYIEKDLPSPLNHYGWSKWAGEVSATMRQPTIIVRLLDLYGPQLDDAKPDFVRQIRDLLELDQEKALPDNLYGTPTYIPHLAEALLDIAARWGDWPTVTIPGPGTKPDVLHIAGDLTLSRFEWGRKIARHFGYDPNLILPTSEIKGAARRPLRGGLNVDLAKRKNIPIYSPDDGLAALSEWERSCGESSD